MALIPLSLIGILPGHALMGAFFTATSMISFIAGVGIVVRNSIILVDLIKLSEGTALKEAVVIRLRQMLLTASAVVVVSSVILFDPIIQAMAIALMAGNTKEIYEAKLKQYDSELNSIEDKLKRIDEVGKDFYITTEYILQLAQKSSELFRRSEHEERRLLLWGHYPMY